jgi:hypothetical protein
VRRARSIFPVIGALFGLMALALTACAPGQALEAGPAMKPIVPPKVARAASPPERRDFHVIERRRWVPEQGYFLTTYRKNQLTPQEGEPKVLMAPDGRHFVVLEDKATRFVSTETGEEVLRLNITGDTYGNWFFSLDGRYFIMPTRDFDVGRAKVEYVDIHAKSQNRGRSVLILIDMKNNFQIQKNDYQSDICSQFLYDISECTMGLEVNNSINSSAQSLEGARVLVWGRPSKGDNRNYYIYDFRTRKAQHLPFLSVEQAREIISQGGFLPKEFMPNYAGGSVKPLISDDLLRNGVIVYVTDIGVRRNNNTSNYVGFLVIDIERGNRVFYSLKGYEDMRGRPFHSYIRGDKISFFGDVSFDGRYTTKMLYTVYRVTPSVEKLFATLPYNDSDNMTLREIYAVRNRDNFLTIHQKNSIGFSDIYLSTQKIIQVPLSLGGYHSRQDISADGRVFVGSENSKDHIYLIQLP